jgi:2-amino-4-hydroxy-6-hydroxymethyldihydropteridine diphosphokinase
MILIAFGANLPGAAGQSPRETCRTAAASLREIAGLTFIALSGWYRTQALPTGDQPDYCNGVIRFEGDADPADLLTDCLQLEQVFARTRDGPNAARTLDIDLIDINGLLRDAPDPILPHPRAHLRGFVLRPIMDVAPGWRHPVLRQSVSTLLSDLPPQRVVPWNEPV